MYYELSSIVIANTSLGLMLETANALNECNVIMEKLLNSATHANDIAITVAQKSLLLDLINEYKLLSNDTDYQAKLVRIENDLQVFTGLTVNELIAQL